MWLSSSISELPQTPELNPAPKECLAELKLKSHSVHILTTAEQIPQLQKLVDPGRYSSMLKLRRVTTLVLRAIEIFKKTLPPLAGDHATLTASDLAKAERLLLMDAQHKLVHEEKFPLWKKQFDLFLHDRGLWRCQGRLGNADIPYSTRHPVLLPRNHPNYYAYYPRSTQSCPAQWCQGDANGGAKEVLDREGAKSCQIPYPSLHHLQEI